MLGFINCISGRGIVDGGVSEGGVNEGGVGEGGVGEGSCSEVDGGFGMESIRREFSTTCGDSTGSLGSTDSIWSTIS